MKDLSLKHHKALLKTIKCVRNYLNRSKLFQSSQEKQNPDFFIFVNGTEIRQGSPQAIKTSFSNLKGFIQTEEDKDTLIQEWFLIVKGVYII